MELPPDCAVGDGKPHFTTQYEGVEHNWHWLPVGTCAALGLEVTHVDEGEGQTAAEPRDMTESARSRMDLRSLASRASKKSFETFTRDRDEESEEAETHADPLPVESFESSAAEETKVAEGVVSAADESPGEGDRIELSAPYVAPGEGHRLKVSEPPAEPIPFAPAPVALPDDSRPTAHDSATEPLAGIDAAVQRRLRTPPSTVPAPWFACCGAGRAESGVDAPSAAVASLAPVDLSFENGEISRSWPVE